MRQCPVHPIIVGVLEAEYGVMYLLFLWVLNDEIMPRVYMRRTTYEIGKTKRVIPLSLRLFFSKKNHKRERSCQRETLSDTHSLFIRKALG